MPRELRNCETNTMKGLKRELDRWLNSKVSDQLKMKLLWIAAETKKNEIIKKYENQNKGNLYIEIYRYHWMIIEYLNLKIK